jgi:hypothetical protein
VPSGAESGGGGDPGYESGVPSDRTLVEVLDALKAEGFTEDVRVTSEGQLCCRTCGHCVHPRDMHLLALRRIEGASDPGDMAAVLGLQCPGCRAKGVAVVRYGPEAGPGDVVVLQHLEDHRRDADLGDT